MASRGKPKDTLLVVEEEFVEVAEDRSGTVIGNGLIEAVGVIGKSETNDGVSGESRDGVGVRGKSTNGHGVFAESSNTYALFAIGDNGAASLVGHLKLVGNANISGKLDASLGLIGRSEGNDAVLGESKNGIGVHGTSITNSGIIAENSSTTSPALDVTAKANNGTAASFRGAVRVAGDIHIAGSSDPYALNISANGKNGALSVGGTAEIKGDTTISGSVNITRSGQDAPFVVTNNTTNAPAALFKGRALLEQDGEQIDLGERIKDLQDAVSDLRMMIERLNIRLRSMVTA